MFDRVPLSLPKVYVSWTQMFYLSKTQGQTTISMIYVFSNSQTASHLSMFTVLLIDLPLLTVPDGRSRLVHAAVMAEQSCTILYPYTIVHLGPVLQCLQKLSGTWPMGWVTVWERGLSRETKFGVLQFIVAFISSSWRYVFYFFL